MFAKGLKAETYIDSLCNKEISHINLQKLDKGMRSKGVVIGLPTFKEKEIEGYVKHANLANNINTCFEKRETCAKASRM